MLVLLNPNAGGGRAAARWEKLEPALAERWPHRLLIPGSAEAAAREALAASDKLLVSAGGDGGVHLLINALMDPATDAPRRDVAIGAIGLGSSNDFHKPRAAERDLLGFPVALDDPRPVDLGRVDFDGRTRYFVLNSSIGAVAEGNRRYNAPMGMLAVLKALHPSLAIPWGALETLWRYRNLPASLSIDDRPVAISAITNLGVLKRVHFAGDMRYDTPVTPDDGLFDVNLCADMSRFELLRAMLAISSGRFLAAKLPNTHHWRATNVTVVPLAPAALELDGEVYTVTRATFRVIQRAIQLCR